MSCSKHPGSSETACIACAREFYTMALEARARVAELERAIGFHRLDIESQDTACKADAALWNLIVPGSAPEPAADSEELKRVEP